jgi:hypothetical protein
VLAACQLDAIKRNLSITMLLEFISLYPIGSIGKY